MKHILISGVAGLIGSHLADRMLERGYRVTGLDDLSSGRLGNIRSALKDKNFVFKRADITDADTLRRVLKGARFDVVAHLAASKKIGEGGSGLKVLTNNLDSTVNLLEIARRHKARFIFASTSDVYGLSNDLPFREDGNCVVGPSYVKRWSYAISKLYGEHLVFAYQQDHGLEAVVIRYFGCFSSRSNYGPSGGHVPLFIKNALEGKVLTIHGDGRQTRSMGSVDDAVEGTVRAIERRAAAGHIINIGSAEEISVADSAKIIITAARKISPQAARARIVHIPMKRVFGDYKEIPRRRPDLAKAKSILGYVPKIRFREAVTIAAREIFNDTQGDKRRP